MQSLFVEKTPDEACLQAIAYCDCGFEFLRFSACADELPDWLVCVSVAFERHSWRERLRHLWRLLTKGKSWPDEFELAPQTARELGEWLVEAADHVDERLRRLEAERREKAAGEDEPGA